MNSEHKKKIILAISHSFCANFIRGQGKFLQENGYKVYLVSADGDEVRRVAESEDVELLVVNFSREISVLKDIYTLFQLWRLLRRVKPDLVNAGNPKSGLLFMIACRLYGKAIAIFTLRGLRSDTLSGAKKKVVRFMETLSCKLSKRTIVISPSLRDHAIAEKVLSSEKAVVLGAGSSNGINLELFTATPALKEQATIIREKLGIDSNNFVIGFAGRITLDKGVVELYKAFNLLRKKYSHVKLVLTGPVEYDDPIPQALMEEIMADPGVYMPGKSSFMPPVLLSYDVLVLPSRREGFGNVALEASAMGRAIIVSDIPGCRDTVENNVTGLLVNVNDPIDICNKLSSYIENRELCDIHGANGRSRVEKLFSSTVIWEGQLELYNDLLNSN